MKLYTLHFIIASLFISSFAQAEPKCIGSFGEPILNTFGDNHGNLIKNLREIVSSEGELIYTSPTPCRYFSVSDGNRFAYNPCSNKLIDIEKRTERTLSISGGIFPFINKNGDVFTENGQVLKNQEGATLEKIPPDHIVTRCGLIKFAKSEKSFSFQLIDGNKKTDLPFEEADLRHGISLFAEYFRCSPNKKYFSYTKYQIEAPVGSAPSMFRNQKVTSAISVFNVDSKKTFTIQQNGEAARVLLSNKGDTQFQTAQVNDSNYKVYIYSSEGKEKMSTGLHGNQYLCSISMVCDTRAQTASQITGQVCDNQVVIRSDSENCDCEKDFTKALEDISQKMNCEVDGTDEAWQRLSTPKSLSEKQLKVFLRKYQKQGGYQAPKDTGVLLAAAKFANESTGESIRSELANTLAYMEVNGSKMPGEIINTYPGLRDKLVQSPSVEFCLSRAEKEKAFNAAQRKIELAQARSYALDLDSIKIMSPFLKLLPEDKKEAFIEAFADRSADIFSQRTGGSNSTGYYMAKYAVQPLFGLKGKDLVDIQQIRGSGTAQLQYIGNKPFTVDGVNAQSAAPGIYLHTKAASLREKSAGEKVHDETASIKMGEDVYQAKSEMTVLPGKGADFVNSSDSIDYKALWKDKKLHGMVFLGSNYLGETAKNDELVGYYLKYYKDQEFKFGEPKKISGTKETILSKIAAGELDYMVKEAHTAADAHSLGRVSKSSLMYEGVKTYKDGRKETITVLVPLADGQPPAAIKRDDFSEAFQERKKKKGEKPFIYVNNACGSAGNTMSEVEKVADKNFVNIGNRSTVNTFWWHKSSTLYNIVDGIRNNRSFPEIKKEMEQTPKYQKGDDRYLLPNAEEYKRYITDQITVPVQLDVKIEKNGADYKLSDQMGH